MVRLEDILDEGHCVEGCGVAAFMRGNLFITWNFSSSDSMACSAQIESLSESLVMCPRKV